MVTTNQEVEDDVKDAPPIFEEGIQATVDELKEINIDATKDVLRIRKSRSPWSCPAFYV